MKRIFSIIFFLAIFLLIFAIFSEGLHYVFITPITAAFEIRSIYVLFAFLHFLLGITFLVVLSQIYTQWFMSRIIDMLISLKKQQKIYLSQKPLEEVVAEEIKKQVPDMDKIFRLNKMFVNTVSLILTCMLAIIIFALNALKAKP